MDQITSINEFIYFTVYDLVTFKVKYTKFNFNYEMYKLDFSLDSLDKGVVFKHFMNNNGIDYTKTINVKDEYIKYFNDITNEEIEYIETYGFSFHNNYMQIKYPISNVSFLDICRDQFMMIKYTDEEYRKLQDYFYTDEQNNYYTKYNFNFNLYSNEFEVFGNKLVVFTDFIIRCINLSSTAFSTNGYGLTDELKKYFIIDNNNIINYLIKYGVSSDYVNVYKSITNIDFIKYGEINDDISYMNETELKEHYSKFGQFEIRDIPFIYDGTDIEEIATKSVGIVYISDKSIFRIGTGFLYDDLNGTNNIYLITCYHLINDCSDINTILASFQSLDSTSYVPVSITAKFRVIGYDIYADILVAQYDPSLEYNIINNVNLDNFIKIPIDFEYVVSVSEDIYTIGNIDSENTKGLLNGKIIQSEYNGNTQKFTLPIPDSLLIQLYSTEGLSGAPVFVRDVNKNLKCIGMINGYIPDLEQFTIGINGFIFNVIINNIIKKWAIYSDKYSDDIIKLNYFIKNGLTKIWLGVISSYYNTLTSQNYSPSLINFPYTGGLIIHDFIIGFNYNSKTFVTDPKVLAEQNTFQINTPLLNTNIYKKFINNGKNPIVITSITYMNGIRSEFSKYFIGQYSNQISYSRIMYGILPIGNKKADSSYVSDLDYLYQNLIIEYYYYNNREWIFETEIIGGNNEKDYNIYTDSYGSKFHQHKFEFPFTLISYQQSYMQSFSDSFGIEYIEEENDMTGLTAKKVVKNKIREIKSRIKNKK